MYVELYQYLLRNKKLSVPGIGTFLLQRRPAESDFLNRQIKAPAHEIGFNSQPDTSSPKLFGWLSRLMNISEREAVIRFNDFAFDVKKEIAAGAIIEWSGLGTLSRGLAGDIKFKPAEPQIIEQPVPAAKVIREKAEHSVRVGEDHRTAAEMTAFLSQPDSARSRWWMYALIIGVAAIGFIVWYLLNHDMDVASTWNRAMDH